MDVIGHKNVATYGDISLFRSAAKQTKRLMNFSPCEHGTAVVSVEGNEVKRAHILKQPSKTRWSAGVLAALPIHATDSVKSCRFVQT
jgi:hypothetical protein